MGPVAAFATTGPLDTSNTADVLLWSLRTCCGSTRRRSRAFRSVVVVLHARDVRDTPVVSVPSVEAIHAEEPDARVGIADHDQAIAVPDVDAERALHDARPFPKRWAAKATLVRALAG